VVEPWRDGAGGVCRASWAMRTRRFTVVPWPQDEPEEARGPSEEPSERAPAVYYAPRGECEYCDRRRAAAARSMRRVREREG
jgi:hypothetical protein